MFNPDNIQSVAQKKKELQVDPFIAWYERTRMNIREVNQKAASATRGSLLVIPMKIDSPLLDESPPFGNKEVIRAASWLFKLYRNSQHHTLSVAIRFGKYFICIYNNYVENMQITPKEKCNLWRELVCAIMGD